MKVDLEEVIEMARVFECCPFCGNHDLNSEHHCEECGHRISVPDDAKWFADYLEKTYSVKEAQNDE